MATLIWVALGLLWMLTLIPFLYARRVIDRQQWPVWTRLLEGDAARQFAYQRDLHADETQAVVDGVTLAADHFARGHNERAHQRLTAALHALGLCSRAARARVQEWWAACRAAASLVPMPPLARGLFRLGVLRLLASVHYVAHHVPVTSGERFRLRLRLLGWGFELLARGAGRLMARLERSPQLIEAPTTWTDAHGLAHDFAALSSATLDSLQALLVAAQTLRRADDPAAGC